MLYVVVVKVYMMYSRLGGLKIIMDDRLSHILIRVNSLSFARLWMFYRYSFHSDEECLEFLHYVLKDTPAELVYYQENGKLLSEVDEDGYKKDLIPRRMLFTVERLVSVARNMDNVRRDEDVFKIVYLVSCVETLQKLCGKKNSKKDIKRLMLFDFFANYTSADDMKIISGRFTRGSLELYQNEDDFFQFVNALNEHRNFAVHQGEFHDVFFNNSDDGYPLAIPVEFDFERMHPKFKEILVKSEGLEGLEDTEEYKEFMEKLRKDPVIHYETTLSYREFEKIFIRTCITFIRQYVSAQEEKTNADS